MTIETGFTNHVLSLLGREQRARLIDEGIIRPGPGEFVTPLFADGPCLALDAAGRASAARSIARRDGSDMRFLGSLRDEDRTGR